MPIYEYRCECGKVVEALVRNGREPGTCGDTGQFCDTEGKLKKLISAHNVGTAGGSAYRISESGASEVNAGASCGSCGQVPGSCGDN